MRTIVFSSDQDLHVTFEQPLTPETFLDVCRHNPERQIEMEPDSSITISSLSTPFIGSIEALFIRELVLFSRKYGGTSYSSSTGFTLPDGSVRSPDASYLTAAQIAKIDPKEFSKFTEMVPKFVVEVRSGSDGLKKLQRKMTDTWMANGVEPACW